jgi:hypothetical protein
VYTAEEEVSAAVVAVSADGGTGAGQMTVIVKEKWEEAISPQAPTSPGLHEVGTGAVEIHWQPPTAGPEPTSYAIYDAEEQGVALVNGSEDSIVLDDLAPGSVQGFSVESVTDGKGGGKAQTTELQLSVPGSVIAPSAQPQQNAGPTRIRARILNKRARLWGRRLWIKLFCPHRSPSPCKVTVLARANAQKRLVMKRQQRIVRPGRAIKMWLYLRRFLFTRHSRLVQRIRFRLITKTLAGTTRSNAVVRITRQEIRRQRNKKRQGSRAV